MKKEFFYKAGQPLDLLAGDIITFHTVGNGLDINKRTGIVVSIDRAHRETVEVVFPEDSFGYTTALVPAGAVCGLVKFSLPEEHIEFVADHLRAIRSDDFPDTTDRARAAVELISFELFAREGYRIDPDNKQREAI